MTLLSQALQVNVGPARNQRRITAEEKELVVAYLKGEIQREQVKKVVNDKSNTVVYSLIARTIKQMVGNGEIKL